MDDRPELRLLKGKPQRALYFTRRRRRSGSGDRGLELEESCIFVRPLV